MKFKCPVCEKLIPVEEGIFVLGSDYCKGCYNKIYSAKIEFGD